MPLHCDWMVPSAPLAVMHCVPSKELSVICDIRKNTWSDYRCAAVWGDRGSCGAQRAARGACAAGATAGCAANSSCAAVRSAACVNHATGANFTAGCVSSAG